MESKQEPVLVSLKVSPWSLKARWALRHHRIHYRTQPYLPVLGEPRQGSVKQCSTVCCRMGWCLP